MFTADLGSVPIDELRRRRSLCAGLDTELSYYRRLLHGRMDLLAFEMRRRRGEESRSLIEALPEILADTPADAPGDGAAEDIPPLKALSIDPPDPPDTGRREIDRVLGHDFLAHLPSIEDDELAQIQSTLTGMERQISRQRNTVYQAYEQILEELARRYRDGLASVDELLQS